MPTSSQRRLLRSPRHDAALGLSALATAAVFAALATRTPLLVALAALLAAGFCWWAVRLLATDALDARVRHAGDRADQARAYRALFAERSAESTAYVGAMTGRLIEARQGRERAETALGVARRRAARAEQALGVAGHRIVVLENHVADLTGEVVDLRERLERPEPAPVPHQRPPAPAVRPAPAIPVETDEPPAAATPSHRAEPVDVPEWDDPRWREQLDPDPAAALLAWEAYSRRLAGRHAEERRQA